MVRKILILVFLIVFVVELNFGVGESEADAWWQAKDSDIATNGSIVSKVPAGQVLIQNGPGGYPGVVTHGGSIDTSGQSVSSKSWQANANYRRY